MVEKKTEYEEMRRKRLEENKKRMEELNLKKLADDVRSTSIKSPSPAKQRKAKPRDPRVLVELRRSGRVKVKPPVSYKEVPVEPLGRIKRPYSYNRRNLSNRVYASDEARAFAIDKAEEVQSGLEPDFPSFVKPMLQSHVTGGFWLGLPVHFCKEHLPACDEFITLEDEDGNESETKYLTEKTGLSGGWRGFAIDHELVDGDALVFQLVNPVKFKVYIIRAYKSEDHEKKDDNSKGVDVTRLDRSAKRVQAGRR